VFTWRAWETWWSTVDDAWITARYAEHLAAGLGPTYSAGEPPVEGFTNTGFTLLLALGRVFGLPMHDLMTVLGFAFALTALGMTVLVVDAITESRHPVALLAPAAFAASPHLAVSSTNGLESTMMVATVLVAVWAHLTVERRWWVGLAAASVIWTRPEGAVVAALLVLHDAWVHRDALARVVPLAASSVGALALLLALRLWFFGEPLPNTFAAKSSFELERTFEVNAVYLVPERHTLWGGLAVWAVGSLLPRWDSRHWLVAAVTLALGVIPLTVNLWMPGLRLFVPALALSVCLLAAGLTQVRLSAGVGASLLGLAALTWFHVEEGARIRRYDWKHSVQPGNGSEIAGQHLAAHLPEGAWLATRDAGSLAYWVGTGVRVHELHQRALTLPHPEGRDTVAKDLGNPEAFVVTTRRDHATDFVYSNDRRVYQGVDVPYDYLGRIYQHYHRYYDIYVRSDLGVPPLPEDVVVNFNGKPAPQ
jgi:hypothetical protein